MQTNDIGRGQCISTGIRKGEWKGLEPVRKHWRRERLERSRGNTSTYTMPLVTFIAFDALHCLHCPSVPSVSFSALQCRRQNYELCELVFCNFFLGSLEYGLKWNHNDSKANPNRFHSMVKYNKCGYMMEFLKKRDSLLQGKILICCGI